MPNPIPATADLVAHYRADAGLFTTAGGTTPATADGDPVGRWEDQSGNGHHAVQATDANRPTLEAASPFLGRPALLFSAAAGSRLANATFDGVVEGVTEGTWVIAYTSTNGVSYLVEPTNDQFCVTVQGGPLSIAANAINGESATTTALLASDHPRLAICRLDLTRATNPGRLEVRVNRVARPLAYSGTFGANAQLHGAAGLVLGGNAPGHDGRLLEVAHFARRLTDPEVEAIEAYFAESYFAQGVRHVWVGGDSIPNGYPLHHADGLAWPQRLAGLLGSPYEVGDKNLSCATAYTTGMLESLWRTRIDPDRDEWRDLDLVLLESGTNNLDAPAGEESAYAAAAIAEMAAAVATRRSYGFTVAVQTVLRREDSVGWPAGVTQASFDLAIDLYDASVRAGDTGADLVFDLAALPGWGPPIAGNPYFWSGDSVHLSDAGTQQAAEDAAAFILAIPPGSDSPPPTLAGAAVAGPGLTIAATLSESGCTPASGSGGFELGGTAVAVESWAISGATLTLTLPASIYSAAVVTLAYRAADASTPIAAGSGAPLADAWGIEVANGSAVAGPVLDVRDYGALGDGAADDAPAIRAALDDLPEGGGTVHVPPGVHLLGGSLAVGRAGTILRGVGPASVLRLAPGVRVSAICLPLVYGDPTMSAAHVAVGVTIRDLTLDGALAPGAAYGENVPSWFALFIMNSTGLTLSGLVVRDWTVDGIAFGNGQVVNGRPAVLRCLVSNCGRNGIHLGFASRAAIRGNRVAETPGQYWGPAAGSSLDVEVEGYDQLAPDPHLPYVRDILIEDNILERMATATGGDAIALQPAYGPMSGFTIRRNLIRNHQMGVATGAGGISYDGGTTRATSDVAIADNLMVWDDCGVVGYPVNLGGGSDFVVTGNTINSIAPDALLLDDVIRVSATGNTLIAYYNAAAIGSACDSVDLAGNTWWLGYHGVVTSVVFASIPEGEEGVTATNVTQAGNTYDPDLAPLQVLNTTPPTVSFSVDPGAVLAGPTEVGVTAAATNGSGIARVWFFADGVPIGVADAPPFTFTVDPTAWPAGTHELSALAVDGLANPSAYAAVAVRTGARPHLILAVGAGHLVLALGGNG